MTLLDVCHQNIQIPLEYSEPTIWTSHNSTPFHSSRDNPADSACILSTLYCFVRVSISSSSFQNDIIRYPHDTVFTPGSSASADTSSSAFGLCVNLTLSSTVLSFF